MVAKSGSKVGSKQHSKMKVQPGGSGKGKGGKGVPALNARQVQPVQQAGKGTPKPGGNGHGY